ncbi:MAG: hypothetical protein D6685_19665, partial [Bacteroidetes bacterium]
MHLGSILHVLKTDEARPSLAPTEADRPAASDAEAAAPQGAFASLLAHLFGRLMETTPSEAPASETSESLPPAAPTP